MTEALSTDGLRRLHDAMAARAAAGELPGLVILVARGDEVHVDTIGSYAFDGTVPMRRDTLFRVASRAGTAGTAASARCGSTTRTATSSPSP